MRRLLTLLGWTTLAVKAVLAAGFTVTPYVQNPAQDAMSIVFFTDGACAATVEAWPAGVTRSAVAPCRATTTGSKATALVAASKSDQPMWSGYYRHQVRFTGLAAGTKYAYEVKLGDGADQTYANCFKTAPSRKTPVRLVAYSDSETCPPPPYAQDAERTDTNTGATLQWEKDGAGKKSAYFVSRSQGFAENIRHMQGENPDLILVAGDVTARGGVQMFWDEYWRENAGGLGRGYNDPAGSTPILAALGNHDLYDNRNQGVYSFVNSDSKFAVDKFRTYFESGNGDLLYHRQDYGPVTLLFLDTVKTGFAEGSDQYRWIVGNLADAQTNAMFTIVVSHQTPYSGGKHGNDQDVLRVRNTLGPLMIRYGVDAWLCGHCEAQEHSQVTGDEELPDGTKRRHTVNVYDLGSGGDGLLCAKHVKNEHSVFNALDDSEDGIHYGHLLVDVKPNAAGVWQLTMTPMYSYIGGPGAPSELRAYADTTVVDGEVDVPPEPPKVDADRTVEVPVGETVTVTTIRAEALWNVRAAAGYGAYLMVSKSRNGDGTYAVTFRGLRLTGENQSFDFVIRYGATTVGNGTKLMTLTVRTVPSETGKVVEDALPPLEVGEEENVAKVLSSSPDALLKAKVTTHGAYTDFKAWVDAGVAAGTIASEEAAKGAAGSFFSFATAQDRIVDSRGIDDSKVKVEAVKVNGGEVALTVGIDGVPVGAKARAAYLSQVFGVLGTSALGEGFAADKVKCSEISNNGDGTVGCTAVPKVVPTCGAFFFKATVAR